ncbi:MAG: sugar phosphate isomerase/epimerase [bacterium]|nr:sugar phosphate isomerase/epimerase [bacterium]
MDDYCQHISGRIGFRLSGFRRYRLRTALEILRNLNYNGVELCLEHGELDPKASGTLDSATLNNYLMENKLTATAVSFHGKLAGWEEKRYKCEAGLELAHELGVQTFISGSIQSHDSDSFLEMCRFTEAMCHRAEKLDCCFAVEPEPNTVIADFQAMERLFQAVGSPRLKVNFDVGHAFLTESNLCDNIIHWGSRIVHTHVEDIRGKNHRHLLPGEGDLDFKMVLDAFIKIKYSGFYTLDLFDIAMQPKYYARIGHEALIRWVE